MIFGQLKTKVADYLNRNDLTSIIPDFINQAMHRIEREHNFNCMQARITGTLTDDTISEPVRFKEVDALFLNINGALRRLTKDSYGHMLSIYPSGSLAKETPLLFARLTSVSKFYMRPYPDSAYSYEMIYYAYTADSSSDSDTNWWTNNAWEALLYGALLEAMPYVADDTRLAIWLQIYNEKITRIISNDKNEMFSGPQALTSDYIGG